MPITDYYVTTDAMGSVMAVLDEAGNVLERRSYDAFGEATYMLPDGTVVANSPTGVDIGFQGQLMDELTGMYQMGYRWYSPVLGRWVSRDPIGLEGGVNPMAFVGNAPVNFEDVYGLEPVEDPESFSEKQNGFYWYDAAGRIRCGGIPRKACMDCHALPSKERAAIGIKEWQPYTNKEDIEFIYKTVVLTGSALAVYFYAEIVFPTTLVTFRRRLLKNIHFDGLKLKPNSDYNGIPTGRIFQIRFHETPVFRLDYTDMPNYKISPVLHMHIWPVMQVHIALEPKVFFR